METLKTRCLSPTDPPTTGLPDPPCKSVFCAIAMLNIWFEFCAPLRYRFFLSWNNNLRGRKNMENYQKCTPNHGASAFIYIYTKHIYIYIYIYMYIYIYIWLLGICLPFLGLNSFTTRVWPKKPLFYTDLCEQKHRALTLYIQKKGSGPHFAAISQKQDPKPLFL